MTGEKTYKVRVPRAAQEILDYDDAGWMRQVGLEYKSGEFVGTADALRRLADLFSDMVQDDFSDLTPAQKRAARNAASTIRSAIRLTEKVVAMTADRKVDLNPGVTASRDVKAARTKFVQTVDRAMDTWKDLKRAAESAGDTQIVRVCEQELGKLKALGTAVESANLTEKPMDIYARASKILQQHGGDYGKAIVACSDKDVTALLTRAAAKGGVVQLADSATYRKASTMASQAGAQIDAANKKIREAAKIAAAGVRQEKDMSASQALDNLADSLTKISNQIDDAVTELDAM